MSQTEYNSITWLQYYYKHMHYKTQQARTWEPMRLLFWLINNMFAKPEDRKTPEQLVPLFTDFALPITNESVSNTESNESMWAKALSIFSAKKLKNN